MQAAGLRARGVGRTSVTASGGDHVALRVHVYAVDGSLALVLDELGVAQRRPHRGCLGAVRLRRHRSRPPSTTDFRRGHGGERPCSFFPFGSRADRPHVMFNNFLANFPCSRGTFASSTSRP